VTTGYCCDRMERDQVQSCARHPDPFDCPDRLVYRSAASGDFGLIVHDGGSSYVVIKFCPWCGSDLRAFGHRGGEVDGEKRG
jgi:hypothetical protein